MVSPNHPFVHRVFHYFHHPFWVVKSPYFWFNIQMGCSTNHHRMRTPTRSGKLDPATKKTPEMPNSWYPVKVPTVFFVWAFSGSHESENPWIICMGFMYESHYGSHNFSGSMNDWKMYGKWVGNYTSPDGSYGLYLVDGIGLHVYYLQFSPFLSGGNNCTHFTSNKCNMGVIFWFKPTGMNLVASHPRWFVGFLKHQWILMMIFMEVPVKLP